MLLRRTFSISKRFSTLPPTFQDKPKGHVKQQLEDAITEDDKYTTEQQVPWTSPTILGRPKKPKSPENVFQHPVLNRDDSSKTILLFPGQGCQYVGMGQKLITEIPSTKDLFDRASAILEYDLLNLCLNGPKETLDQTEFCQPAVVVTSLAAVEALWETDETAVKNCVATAGFSVGEITALIFSGALSFEEGLRLTQIRGKAMQTASNLQASGMMTIFYGKSADISLACQAARKWVEETNNIQYPVCQVANHLYNGGKVLAGHIEALEFIDANKKDFGIRKTKWLPVSGAFHTDLMIPAKDIFEEAMSHCSINDPRIPVYSNYKAGLYRQAKHVKWMLPKQITGQVKWESLINNIMKYSKEEDYPRIIECGPGSTLTPMLKNISGKIAKRASVVQA